MNDASLAPSILEAGEPELSAPVALIEACGLPEIGSRLSSFSVRLDDRLATPFQLDGSTIRLRPDAVPTVASAAVILREALELAVIGGSEPEWPHRILAHATAAIYAATTLRSRRGTLVSLNPATHVESADVALRPLETAERLAHAISERDHLPQAPADLVQQAATALPLALPTEVLLASGGDDRQAVDWAKGVNSYGIPPEPTPWKAAFGSCTASAPTFRAFEAAQSLRHQLIEAALRGDLDSTLDAVTARIRSTLLTALGVPPNSQVEVVLTPSGTDVELLALALSGIGVHPVTSIVIAPNEIGSGSLPAAQGRHFSSSLPSGEEAEHGHPISGLNPDDVHLIEIPVRSDSGEMLGAEQVEALIETILASTDGQILLHIVDGSKTGIRLPRSETVKGWENLYRDRLVVFVDAAQMRVDQETVLSHLKANRMVSVTGSKFFGGPPFSGALLIPPTMAETVGDADCFPLGLADYLTDADIPSSLPSLKTITSQRVNFGLLARWEAALAEMRSFHNASPEIRDQVLRVLAKGLRTTLESCAHVKIVESPYSQIPAEDDRGLDNLPTIFTFYVRHPDGDRFLDHDEAKTVHTLLGQDISRWLGAASQSTPGRSYHLGQPVKIAKTASGWLAGLRLAVGAPTVSQVVFDHTRGEHWTARVERELADVQDVLDKLGLILERVDLSQSHIELSEVSSC